MSQELTDAFVDMREADVLKITHDLLDRGTEPLEILAACKDALEVIGQRFEEGQAFVPELVMSGEMMNQVTAIVKPRVEQEAPSERLGRVLMGTVDGDIHDIGKDVVVFMLDANGFEVIDLGVDVKPEAFVEKIHETQPDVVGLSGLLTLAFDSMRATVDTIREAGLREKVKIMIGGAPVDDHVREYTGADAWGKDAMEAVALAKQWTGR
ncbi:MAG: cobalamin-dependent protein [Anaerolineae bacterium]|jgi:5-methyltetrahydrofolate--homocysteine methyltransferase